MQSDINKIVEWCETWSMDLCQEKCNLGNQTNPEDYFIAEKNICVRDLGVFVSSDRTCHKQVSYAASKANRV